MKHSIAFLPSGTSLLSITGDASFDLGCFDIRHDYDPALGFARRVAILGNLRTGEVDELPGAKLLYGADDRPGGGSLELLSPALGVTNGVGDSDGSTLTLSPGLDGSIRLDLHRPGRPCTPTRAAGRTSCTPRHRTRASSTARMRSRWRVPPCPRSPSP